MKVLFVHGSSDPFSHQMGFIRSAIEGDYTARDIELMAAKYKAQFERAAFSAIALMLLDVDAISGRVEVLMNVQGTHPLKVRVEVNQEALKVREERNKGKKNTQKAATQPTLSQILAGGIQSATIQSPWSFDDFELAMPPQESNNF